MAEIPETTYFSVRPDWVCEVRSAATARTDRERKLPLYADAGTSYAWLVDPALRTLEVFRLGPAGAANRFGLFGESDQVRAEPFQAFALDLALLWRHLKRR